MTLIEALKWIAASLAICCLICTGMWLQTQSWRRDKS